MSSTGAHLAEVHGTLQGKALDFERLENLSVSLQGCQTVAEVVTCLTALVPAAPETSRVRVFISGGDGLVLWGPEGPDSDNLLLGLQEPLVEKAHALGARCTRSSDPGKATLFPEDQRAVAIPLGPDGVLYVGRRAGPPFTADELTWLQLASAQGRLALEKSLRMETIEHSLEHQSQTRAQAESWALQLEQLVDHARDLVVAHELQQLFPRLEQMLGPYDSLVLAGCHQSQWEVLYRQPSSLDIEPSDLLLQVLEEGQPVVFEQLDRTRFSPLWPGENCLVALPFHARGQVSGGLLVSSSGPTELSRRPSNFLRLLGFMMGAAWDNVNAYQRLQESQAQLVQSSKLAAVGQLAAGVAHELNTPLASILLNLDMARRYLDNNPAKALEKMESLAEQAKRAQSSIENLLYYSRNSGKGLAPVDLVKVAEDSIELLAKLLERDQLQLVCELAPLKPVKANAGEVQQILTNLLLNARDAVKGCQDGRVTVRSFEQGHHRGLEVEDSGTGISAEVAERIFEPFFTTKPVGSGTGLGLSLSRQLADGHGATLDLVESEPGKTVFRLSYPG